MYVQFVRNNYNEVNNDRIKIKMPKLVRLDKSDDERWSWLNIIEKDKKEEKKMRTR